MVGQKPLSNTIFHVPAHAGGGPAAGDGPESIGSREARFCRGNLPRTGPARDWAGGLAILGRRRANVPRGYLSALLT